MKEIKIDIAKEKVEILKEVTDFINTEGTKHGYELNLQDYRVVYEGKVLQPIAKCNKCGHEQKFSDLKTFITNRLFHSCHAWPCDGIYKLEEFISSKTLKQRSA